MAGGEAERLKAVEKELAQVEAQIARLLDRQQALQKEQERLRRAVAVEARALRADWRSTFPWDARVAALLAAPFGLQEFRPLQREVINATMQGCDVLCLMPSGGGKSLTFQLPALLGRGRTVVISPLLSLIQDQVAGLAALGVGAAALTSLTSKELASAILKQIDDPAADLRLLYCTPEKAGGAAQAPQPCDTAPVVSLASPRPDPLLHQPTACFPPARSISCVRASHPGAPRQIVNSKRLLAKLEKAAKAGLLDRFTVDEVHCASAWGNDFRPDYKKLGVLKQQFPAVPMLALTATATQAVCDEVCDVLCIEGCELFRRSVDRPNLFYEVRDKPASAEALLSEMAAWISTNFPDGESGIVYVLTRKDAENVAAELRSTHGLAAAHYHAEMEPEVREAVHRRWAAGELQAIVATIAFGMGINKPESGRAGRDGLPAHCLLFFRHFAEAPAPCHGMCDWCRRQRADGDGASGQQQEQGGQEREQGGQQHNGAGEATRRGRGPPQKDVSEAARAALLTLRDWAGSEKRATLTQLVDKWRASKDAAVAKATKALSRDECELTVQALATEGCLRLDFGFTAYNTNTYLKLAAPSAAAAAVLQGMRQVFIAPRQQGAANTAAVKPTAAQLAAARAQRAAGGATAGGAAPPAPGPAPPPPGAVGLAAAELRAALRGAALALAEAHGTLPAAVLSDDQASLLAAQRPASRQQLAVLIGEGKAHLYGERLLQALHGGGSGAKGRANVSNDQQQEQQGADGGRQEQQARRPQRPQQQKARQRQQQGHRKQEQEVVELLSSDSDDGSAFAAPPAAKRRRA
eukprot:scaffold10.g2461.t1